MHQAYLLSSTCLLLTLLMISNTKGTTPFMYLIFFFFFYYIFTICYYIFLLYTIMSFLFSFFFFLTWKTSKTRLLQYHHMILLLLWHKVTNLVEKYMLYTPCVHPPASACLDQMYLCYFVVYECTHMCGLCFIYICCCLSAIKTKVSAAGPLLLLHL